MHPRSDPNVSANTLLPERRLEMRSYVGYINYLMVCRTLFSLSKLLEEHAGRGCVEFLNRMNV